MAVLSAPAGGSANDPASLARQMRALQSAIQSIQVQTNTAPTLFSNTGGKVPIGVVPGSLNVTRQQDGSITLDVADSSGFGNPLTVAATTPSSSAYLSPQTHTGAPSTTQFPLPGNFGWYKNTTSGNWYFTLNFGGSLVFQDISTLSGTITATQHGNLAGGALHAAATTSANGFATATQIVQLNQATTDTAAVTAIVTNITSTGTPTNTLNATVFYVNGVPVLDGQMAVLAPLGGGAVLSDVITAFNTLLARLKSVLLMHT